MIKIKKPKKLNNKLLKEPTISKDKNNDFFLLSLKHLDKTQWETFFDWEKKHKLSKLLETMYWYSNEKLIKLVDNKKFSIYWDFPPKNKTKFEHPKHVPEDANWARIHIDWTHCLIWHVIANMFFAVFLDWTHSFWKSKKSNT